jgi:DNA-binding NarL/FixJ family response regulator
MFVMTDPYVGVGDSSTPPARIIIADNHPLYRDALRDVLSDEPNLEVVGEAEDGQQAIELCRHHQPELVLMEVRMPRMDGLAATRQIKRERPHTIVLILTSFENPDYLAEALKAGASGYVLKDAFAQELMDAIREALSGESPIDPKLSS